MPDLQVVTLDGGTTRVSERDLGDLAANLNGDLLRAGDDDYEGARLVWNGMIDRRPALIARCAGVPDVVAAVRFARTHHMLLAVRGGGHNVAGTASCDGGLVIDLLTMKDVQVDAATRVARVGGGATWGDVDTATQAFGLATPGGVVSDTGVAGLTLGGGLGWIRRKHGLSCDNVIAAEMVTADGAVVRASADGHPDLYWALRGGGGNFGVVTSFEFQLHPIGPDLTVVFTFYPADRAAELLRFYREYAVSAPDEVSSFAIFGSVPAVPDIPAEAHGQQTVIFFAAYAGPVEEGEAVMRPLREQGTALADLSGPMAYLDLQKAFDEDYPAHDLHYYWKSLFLPELSDAAVARLAALNAERPSPLSTIDVWQLGGAMGRVRPEDTAFPERAAPFLLGVEANWADAADDAANVAWARRVIEEMTPFSTGASYLNFEELRDEGPQAALQSNYDRLARVKARYDPTNLFRVNLNVKPATTP